MKKVFSYRSLQFGKKKHFYGENFRYRKNICEIGRAGGCCSDREGWNVWISSTLSASSQRPLTQYFVTLQAWALDEGFSKKNSSRKFSEAEKMVLMKGSFRNYRKLPDLLLTTPKPLLLWQKSKFILNES